MKYYEVQYAYHNEPTGWNCVSVHETLEKALASLNHEIYMDEKNGAMLYERYCYRIIIINE